jgi:threonine synthase
MGKVLARDILVTEKRPDIWRYAHLLPISDISVAPPLSVGRSPMYHAKNLGELFGLDHLYLKDDGRNPSASLKDRASAVALANAIEKGAGIVTAASTGNAGCSMACLSASVGMPSVIFVPESAPEAKIAQLLIFGATVVAVRGSYDDAFDLCLEVTDEFGWYNRNTGYNPYTREGKKTCLFEICEEFNWKAPDVILISTGDGNIISGFWKGLRDLKEIGLIPKMSQLIAVQSTKSNALSKAVAEIRNQGIEVEKDVPLDFEIEPVDSTTIADSISVDSPRDGIAALRSIFETGGDVIEVTDDEILEAISLLGKREGVFAEPAGAAATAAVKRMAESGTIEKDSIVVSLVSGNGLKDVPAAMKVAGSPHVIDPTIDDFKKLRLDRHQEPGSQ